MFEIQNVNYKSGTGSGLFTLLQYKIKNTATGLYLGYYHKTYYKGAHYAAIYPLSTANQNTNTWFFQADGSVNYKIINSNSELEGWNHLTFSDSHEGLSPGIPIPIAKGYPPATLHEESSSNLLWQIEEGANGYNIKNPTKGVDGYLNFVNTAYYKGNHHFAEVRNKMPSSDWKVQLDMSSVSLEYNVTNIKFDNLKPEFFKKERVEDFFCSYPGKTATCPTNSYIFECKMLNLDSETKKDSCTLLSYQSSAPEKLVVDGKLMGKLNDDSSFVSMNSGGLNTVALPQTVTIPPNSCIKIGGHLTWFNYFINNNDVSDNDVCENLSRLWENGDTLEGLPFTTTAEVSAYADVLNQETGVQKNVRIDNPEAIKHILLESYEEGDAPKILDMSGKDTISIQLSGKIAFKQLVHTEIQTDYVDCATLSDAKLRYCLQVTNQNCEYTDPHDEL